MKRRFKIGTAVKPDPAWAGGAYSSIHSDWERSDEERGFMIVTNVNESGWIQFDNETMNSIGGFWNPQCFIETSIQVKLDEGLFEI